MSFSEEQSRRLDAVVGEMVEGARESVEALVREWAEQEVERRWGAQPDVPALQAPREHFRRVVAEEMAETIAERLTERLLGAYAAA